MAETVFKQQVAEAGLMSDYEIDSAGTAGYHVGQMADERMRSHASRRHYHITSIGRQVQPDDFSHFDAIVAMDDSNLRHLQEICPPAHSHKLHKMTDFASHTAYSQVPDPYYGGAEGFELVIDILEDASQGLLHFMKKKA